jgi:hypothetical protein
LKYLRVSSEVVRPEAARLLGVDLLYASVCPSAAHGARLLVS